MSNRVFVEYNPYEPKLRVFVNDHNISQYSGLWTYEDKPFTEWCGKLLEVIEREVNGEYLLEYSCDDTTARIIEALAESNRYCTSAVRLPYTIPLALEERLEMAAALGADEEKKATVYLLGDEEIQSAAFEILLENELFEDLNDEIVYTSLPCFKISVKPTERFDSSLVTRENAFVYITVSDEPDEVYRRIRGFNAPVFVLHISGDTRFVRAEDGFLFFDVAAEDLTDLLVSIAADLPISLVFGEERRRLIAEQREGSLLLTGYELHDLILSGRTKPYYNVDIGDTTYLGRSYVLSADEHPFMEDGEFAISSSDPSVISTDGMRIKVESVGTAKLTLTKNGDPYGLWEKQVTVLKETFINALAIFPELKRMRVGQEDHINVRYYPEDAVNAFEIKWKMDNEEIATVDQQGNVKALQAGDTVLHIYTPDARDRMLIKVEG